MLIPVCQGTELKSIHFHYFLFSFSLKLINKRRRKHRLLTKQVPWPSRPFIIRQSISESGRLLEIFAYILSFHFIALFFQAWKSEGIKIEGSLLMYEGIETCQKCRNNPTISQRNHGARYLVPFSPECPHFEV